MNGLKACNVIKCRYSADKRPKRNTVSLSARGCRHGPIRKVSKECLTLLVFVIRSCYTSFSDFGVCVWL